MGVAGVSVVEDVVVCVLSGLGALFHAVVGEPKIKAIGHTRLVRRGLVGTIGARKHRGR